MKSVDIFEYIILKRPTEIQSLLKQKGFVLPQYWSNISNEQRLDVLANALHQLTKQDEESKMKVLSLHPDLKVIDAYLIKRNANKYFSADAETTPSNKQDENNTDGEKKAFMSTKTSNILMGVGIAVFSVIIFKQLI